MSAPGPSPVQGNDPVRGAVWMVAATTCFALMAIFIRMLAGKQTAFDITFWRSVFGTLVMLPFMLRGLKEGMFRTRKMPLMSLRAIFTYVAMASYFYAIAEINIVDAVALNATIPLWTILLVVLFLPEKVGPRRWVGTAIGFAGAMVILRPGFQEIGIASLLALGSAFFYAAAGITVKILSRTEPTARIVFYMNLLLVVIAAVPWALSWNPPQDWESVILLVAIGIAGTLAHVCITRAYQVADASFCAPFDFWRLVLVVIAGWLIFDDPGSVWTWVGGIIVFASAAYVTRREALARKAD